MSVRIGVVTFPGSNCDHDTLWALDELGAETAPIWYRTEDLDHWDGVVLPGGFSYGDYLRSGALAAKAPVLGALRAAVQTRSLPVLGICNGFQILTEAGLLPGALRPNRHGQFRCEWDTVRVVEQSPWFPGLTVGQRLRLPIAHAEGSYYVPSGQLGALFQSGEAWLQYVDDAGRLSPSINPNGSIANLAGVQRGSVAALMPHPERAMASYLGSDDGRRLLGAWVKGVSQEAIHAR